jgi:predicted transcriptional regulator
MEILIDVGFSCKNLNHIHKKKKYLHRYLKITMDLKSYLDKMGIRPAAFARRVGVSAETIMRILRGADFMISTALRIEDATVGKVKC